ncbi:MAG: caspase family protein [Saccharospirillaceae bacterium]|nr:caspase family protein [Pseudomonadales bacterium]NRB77487.1 caspase family protein [Saccharospirillaceae bacterium]
MKLFNILLVTSISICVALNSQANVKSDTQGVKRYAVIAGSNSGGQQRITLKYADDDAQSFSDVFTSLGGLEDQNNHLLLEPTIDELLSAIQNVNKKIAEDQAKIVDGVKPRVEFIFYYSGHSDEKSLLLGEQSLTYKALKDSLKAVNADVKLAILDSCASGAFTRLKGGQSVKPFLANESSSLEGYAYLASSSVDEAAQESDAIEGAYFTHYLVSALRGAADISKDNKITLDEAYQYASSETLARTQGSVYGAQHAAYDIQLSGESSLVLTDLTKTSANLLIKEDVIGRIYIRDQNGRLKVELNKFSAEPLTIGLEPGVYQITIENNGKVYQQQKFVINKGITELRIDSLNEIDPTYSVARGGVKYNEIEELGFKFSVIPSMQFPANINNNKQRVKLDLNIFGNQTYQIKGLAMGSIYNYIEDSTKGALIAGTFNYNKGDFSGWSMSGVANVHLGQTNNGNMFTGVLNYSQNKFKGFMASGTTNISQGATTGLLATGVANIILNDNTLFSDKKVTNTSTSKGFMASGVLNYTQQSYKGLQATGVVNISLKQMQGAQFSGVVNIANDMDGLQMSGVVNIANKMKGFQFGVVNVAKEMDGYTFGLINIIGDGRMDVAVSYDELEFINVGIKTGSKKSYSHLFIAKHKDSDIYKAGFGLGLTHNITNKIVMDNSLSSVSYLRKLDCEFCDQYDSFEDFEQNIERIIVAKYQIDFGYKISNYLKPNIGFSYNKTIDSNKEEITTINEMLTGPNLIKDSWFGFNVGIDI